MTGLAQSNSPSNFDSRYHNLEGGSAIGQRRITESVERINRGERFHTWWWNLITNWWVENPLLERSVDANWEQDRQALLRVFDLTGDNSCISQSTCIEEAERALSVYSNRLEEIEASQSPESSLRMAQNLILRGATYQVLGQTQQKEADWEQAIDVINKSQLTPINYVKLGNELYNLGYRQRAVELWETAQDSAGEDNLPAYLELGRFLHQFGQGSAARQYWNQIVNALPSNSSLRLALADQYVYFSRIGYQGYTFDNTALDKANEAIQLEGENPYNWIGHAQILIGLEELGEARNSLEQARQFCSETLCEEIITRIETYQLGLVAQREEEEPRQRFFECREEDGEFFTVMQIDPEDSEVFNPLIHWVPFQQADGTSREYVGHDRYSVVVRGTGPGGERLGERLTALPGFQISLETRCHIVSNRLEALKRMLLDNPDILRYAEVDLPFRRGDGTTFYDPDSLMLYGAEMLVTVPVVCLEGFDCSHSRQLFTLTLDRSVLSRLAPDGISREPDETVFEWRQRITSRGNKFVEDLQNRLRNPEQPGEVLEN
ncbi:tetratricopeptide repeat protein [Geitlerinema sp. P-1104]|uniref:tetratricopeptide repeat protein n=1 Tax=Geitlerinema sp. P-1104 TaxID=2546230 RepID=UPI001477379D|nr:tetratricopeptide repeat protein [Geitlerinema sp. P-1104]NMG60556.1 tetratricopeptide repeat protein [Geitlerinema sp. P-1104]